MLASITVEEAEIVMTPGEQLFKAAIQIAYCFALLLCASVPFLLSPILIH